MDTTQTRIGGHSVKQVDLTGNTIVLINRLLKEDKTDKQRRIELKVILNDLLQNKCASLNLRIEKLEEEVAKFRKVKQLLK